MCHEDKDDTDVIAGTFFIHYISYFYLIDIGSIYSYVGSTISVKLSISTENTTRETFIISPLGLSVGVNKMYRRVSL